MQNSKKVKKKNLYCISIYFEIETLCNIINICIVTFDQLNASLLNKSIN